MDAATSLKPCKENIPCDLVNNIRSQNVLHKARTQGPPKQEHISERKHRKFLKKSFDPPHQSSTN